MAVLGLVLLIVWMTSNKFLLEQAGRQQALFLAQYDGLAQVTIDKFRPI